MFIIYKKRMIFLPEMPQFYLSSETLEVKNCLNE